MSGKNFRVARTFCVLLLVLLLSVQGCFFSSGNSNDNLSDLEAFFFFSALKGLVLCWEIPRSIPWIVAMQIIFPPAFAFGGFDRRGTFVVHSPQVGLQEFQTIPIKERVLDPAFYVDFNSDRMFDSNFEPKATWESATNSLRLQNPPPVGSMSRLDGPMGFALTLPDPLLLDQMTGADQFAFNLEVNMMGANGSTYTMHKLLLINAQVLPHIAIGRQGDLQISSRIDINNAHNTETEVEVEFFRPDGTPWAVNVDNGTALEFSVLAGGPGSPVKVDAVVADEHAVIVPAKSNRSLNVTSNGEVEVGWALIYGTQPVDSSVTFSTTQGGVVDAEAGIAASNLGTSHVLSVEKSASGLNTAFAIVNPTDAEANIRLEYQRQNQGAPIIGNLTLGPRSYTARFFDELFGIEGAEESGTGRLISNTDLAVMSLRTLQGKQSASLPSGLLQVR